MLIVSHISKFACKNQDKTKAGSGRRDNERSGSREKTDDDVELRKGGKMTN